MFCLHTGGEMSQIDGMKFAQLKEVYDTPFFDLISRARSVYLENWKGNEVQLCTLLSIKTGG